MSNRLPILQRGALTGLALLFSFGIFADDALRDQVRRDHRHQSYMLVEGVDGARLYLFDNGVPSNRQTSDRPAAPVSAALAKTRSSDARERVRGLVELAGVASPEALDTALLLLNDPSPAVRDEARNLILDHPDGALLAASLGLVDDDLEEQED